MRKILIILPFFSFILIPFKLSAAIYTVNTPFDAVDATPGDGVCKISGANLCTLRAAIQEVNAGSGGDEIDLPAGTYLLMISGTDDAAAMGDLDIKKNVTIRGDGSGVTVVNGNSAATNDRVFDILAPATSVTFEGFEIQNGNAGAGNG